MRGGLENARGEGHPHQQARHVAGTCMGHPEEMDGLVTLLASAAASYITGQTIAIDGGKTAI